MEPYLRKCELFSQLKWKTLELDTEVLSACEPNHHKHYTEITLQRSVYILFWFVEAKHFIEITLIQQSSVKFSKFSTLLE